MSKIKANQILREAKADGVETATNNLLEALEDGLISPEDLSIRQIAEATIVDKKSGKPIGREILNEAVHDGRLDEAAANYIDPSAFSKIFNQYLYNTLIPRYMADEFVVANSFGVVKSSIQRGELVPGISNLGDVGQKLSPGKEFPLVGPSEDYLQTPPLEKTGFRTGIEWEAAVHDNTGLLLERTKDLGTYLGVMREKQACDVVIDSATANVSGENTRWAASNYRYNWKNASGTAALYPTYETTASPGDWINQIVQPLNDAFSINAMWETLVSIKDPNTQEPMMDPVGGFDLLVTQYNIMNARRIQHTVELRSVAGSGTTTNTAPMLITGPNGDIIPEIKTIYSKYLTEQLTADGSRSNLEVYFGKLSEAFKWFQFSDIFVEEEAVPGRQGTSFTHHLLTQFRCYRYEVPVCFQPRRILKATPS